VLWEFQKITQLTGGWQNNIPDGNGVKLGQTRKRSDTVSTAHSDSHDQKGTDWRKDIFTVVYVAESRGGKKLNF